MARNAYEDDLLTPSQRLEETYRIAPGGGVDVGNRLSRDVALTASANALENPLLVPRDNMGGGTAAVAGVPVSAVPNPMIRQTIAPPVPRNMMGVEQQLAWQQLEDDQRAKQDDVESRKLEAEIRRQQLDHRAEQVRQNQELATHMPKLREALNTSPEAYLDLKADLASRYAIGMGSPESDKIFSEFEKIYTKREDTEAGIKKARIAREEANRLKREDILLKDAGQYGGEVAREVAARLADPLKGVDDASALLAQVQEKSVVQGLRDARLNDEQIAQYGTGKDFNYQAARAALKSKTVVAQERNRATTDWLALYTKRKDAGFDPASEDPYKDAPDWNPNLEKAYEAKLEYMNSFVPDIGDNRAGVQGMSPGAIQVAQQQAFNYATAPAKQPVVTVPPAVVPPPREKIYRNPQTGERIALRNGKWEKI